MLKKRNFLAFLLSIISGLLLLFKGIQGPTDFYFFIFNYVSSLLSAGIIRSILMVGLLVLIVLSSLGGLTVAVGGFFIWFELKVLGFVVMFHSYDYISLFVPFINIPVSLGSLFYRIVSIYDRFYLSRLNKLFEEN